LSAAETASAPVLLSLGSNIGDRLEALQAAVHALAVLPGTVLVACSHSYETDAVGVLGQAAFLNAAVRIETELEPLALLGETQRIERELGRIPGQRWGPRRIDIDIVLWGELIKVDARLMLPHAAFRERAFVLLPLREIAPEAVDPVSGKTVAELAEALGAHARVELGEALTP
jgi:2-amino-4-hydroxy-6-hydroxymethyldihydropteridine diphosphokinase